MSDHTTLLVDRTNGGTRRTRYDLEALYTPPATATWKPIPHHDLVAALIAGLEAQGITVGRDDYCTMGRNDAKLLGVMDLSIPDLAAEDFGMGLAMRTSNDRSMAIQLIAAARVFVCDNSCFSGSDGAVFLRKLHTRKLDLGKVVPGAVAEFLGRTEAFRADLGRMKDFALSDGRAKEIIHDAFAADTPALPVRFLPRVARLYFHDDEQRGKFPERSLWALNNAFTEAVKALPQGVGYAAGLRVGRLFGRILKGTGSAGNPIEIDGIEINVN